MSDVKDILGIQSSAPAQPSPFKATTQKNTPPPPPPDKKRKRSSAPMRRELNALQEDLEKTMPALMPTILAQPKQQEGYKEKRKLGTKADKWVWKPFKNSARTDKAVFYHWVKQREASDDYRFAKFNKKIKMYDYTDEQYEKYFKSDTWTKEETDRLYSLCRQYDLRFFVIYDKWPDDGRTIEHLKERYYSIQRKLIELNKDPSEDISSHPLIKHPYNAEQDRERKRQNEILFQRSKAQVQEEEHLLQEWARLDSAYKKHTKDAQRILTIIGKQQKLDEQSDTQKTGGAYTKSSKLFPTPPFSAHKHQKYQPYITQALEQLGINASPNASPVVANAINELQNDLILLFEMQTLYAEMEYEVLILQEQLALTQQQLKEAGEQVPMDVDEPADASASTGGS